MISLDGKVLTEEDEARLKEIAIEAHAVIAEMCDDKLEEILMVLALIQATYEEAGYTMAIMTDKEEMN